MGIYGNLGYKLNENQLLSIHARNDDHKQTGGNKTYKYSFIQKLNDAKFRLTHSTGLKIQAFTSYMDPLVLVILVTLE